MYYFQIRTGDKEETVLHQLIKNLIAHKLIEIKSPLQFSYSYYPKGKEPQSIEDVKKEIEKKRIDPNTQKPFYKNCSLFYIIPPKLYKAQVDIFVEREHIRVNNFLCKPDLSLFNSNIIDSAIEIIHKGKPSYEKLTAYINSKINVVWLYVKDHMNILEEYNQQDFRLKCSYGWRGNTPLHIKYAIAIHMMQNGKAWDSDVKRIRYNKNTGYHIQNYINDKGEWHDSPSTHATTKNKKAKNSNRFVEKLCEDYVKSLPPELNNPKSIPHPVKDYVGEFLLIFQCKGWKRQYEDPFLWGNILEMHREGQPYRKEIWNAHTAVIDKTQSFLDYEAGQTYKFMCGVGDYGQEGQHKYYANKMGESIPAPKPVLTDQVWELP